MEIQSLLHPITANKNNSVTSNDETKMTKKSFLSNVNIEQMYELLQEDNNHFHNINDMNNNNNNNNDFMVNEQEEFWREIGQSDDRFDTITRFFGKGYIL